jgi:hypothetical protein
MVEHYTCESEAGLNGEAPLVLNDPIVYGRKD